MMIADILQRLLEGRDLDAKTASGAARALMAGELTPAQSAALLTLLKTKSESVTEIAAFAQVLRSQVLRVKTSRSPLLDTCGTGGSTFKTFNVSTCVSLLLASQGVAVAKHGNRAMSGTCGSADVLEALGVNLALSPETAGAVLERVGIVFLFAQAHHPAMKQVAPLRRELGFRTIFNLLGPLVNPAGASLQLMGVYEKRVCALAVGALKMLGSERAMIVYSEAGADEILTFGQTFCSQLHQGEISERILSPADFGLGKSPPPDLAALGPGPSLAENAEIVLRILSGTERTRQDTDRLNLVAVNAGAAFTLAGFDDTLSEGFERARAALKSGEALTKLQEFIQATQASFPAPPLSIYR